MVWKQDLAKLKQALKSEGGPPAPPPPPKPAPRPDAKPIQDEDALFLAAMGQAPAAPRPAAAPLSAGQEPRPQNAPEPPAEDFGAAMAGLKGMKALEANPVLATPPAPVVPSVPAPPPPAALPTPIQAAADPHDETRDIPPPAAPAKEPPGPRLIHLAAGMAVEVDGALDLRGHSLTDARERLKERVQDAQAMGWRTMHVTLGPSEALRQGFLVFLVSPAAAPLVRYAQAPIPMGGAQAWILYFGGPSA